MQVMGEQVGVACTVLRGGTSKGLYFNAADLPPAGARRDRLLMALLGAHDLLQIDGLGGSRLVTAKLAIVGPPTHPEADVDYTYGIVPPGEGRVVFTSNCGNISAGVGPFAIDAGLVPAEGPVARVRIHNTNTGKLLVAHVPVADGHARVRGDFAIPGVPGTGARIFMDYRATIGAKTGRGMPTGRARDEIALDDGRRFEVSLCDVGNPCVFVAADALGLSGTELPNAIDADAALLSTLKALRARAAALLGLCDHWREADSVSPALPLVVIVAPPTAYADAQGRAVTAAQVDLCARLVFYGRCHESMAGTGAICTAACASVEGSVVHAAARCASERVVPDSLHIGHPLGAMRVDVQGRCEASRPLAFEALGFARTARRLMDGTAWVPRSVLDPA
ncbi:2-methylaconitate cis-trans isomerase PrpF family protein [Variovorax sp. CY25R-8]|uniref:2-methylaconitate cis-trans isomerase PrpF family protein n=1 Tax=Variovorax sp. CY25R-8 TaxID=2855501 RepID=UPI0021BAE5FC|nr:PrpF domain-containing protein [Variovorax sp. CY25R-8]MCT8175713.1 PrpF protein [Variovorax sp. CY25R-8]